MELLVENKKDGSQLSLLPVNEIYKAFNTSPQGLTQAEAQVRLEKFGRNTLSEGHKTPLILKFLANFTHLMALLLWAGGIVGFLANAPQLGIAIWTVNLINGVFSFWQEYKAEKATEALKRMLPNYARVIRDGSESKILAEELVPGDLLMLEEGDNISADARIIDESDLRVDQSTLTGESRQVRKTKEAALHTELGVADIANLIFAGTGVASGRATAVVTATGMQTEFGKIAHLTLNVTDQLSPLQRELGRVTKIVTMLATGIGSLFFVLAIFLAKVDLATSFIFAMGMIVAFVPEGMLPTVTLALALGVQRMAKRNALVKRLSAVETLGCTTVICTDKTGTLTQNEMTVTHLWLPGHMYEFTGTGYAPQGHIVENAQKINTPVAGDLHLALRIASLCNDARILPPDGDSEKWRELGDPTEASLEVAALKGWVDLKAEATENPRIRELPFDSYRKRMSTINRQGNAQVAYVKGAPKEVLELCNFIQQEESVSAISESQRLEVMQVNDRLAREGLRVLALAYRILPDNTMDFTAEQVEHDLIFLGLVAMRDQPRTGVGEAIARCHKAGIRVVMITGDYELTAASIAKQLGIVTGEDFKVITGLMLDRMSDAALKDILKNAQVIFARVTPAHKLKIVTTFQELGHIVAVTGDGVNDAPALKKAHIGVAMGQAGTDVAKEAADMVLTDDNFASIVNAVEEGRAIYSNIRKFAMYVFNSNMAEAVPFVAMLFSRGAIPLPLTVMQVLAIDLGTDMVPAIGLGTEPPEAGVMELPPRSQKEPLLNPKLLARALLWYGLIESIASMSAYFFLNWRFGWPGVPLAAEGTEIYRLATTMTLAGVVATQVGAVFVCRTERNSVFKIGFFKNRLVLIGIVVELGLLVSLVYLPFMQGLFNTAPLDIIDWLFVFAWTPVIFFADEARKLWWRWRNRQQINHITGGV
ncbi:MAG: cation-transporting P-type ATPase [Chloroflexi bacterium]|uniref:Cation-transporting P-type ATPase n=1 Tax=Candidatus Chlorohelix allophototropha TaxID=3003348 RepID=A0A8T7M104_9CHLR|nr:cation-transporting P-type ATPase [Chloroflexota bacterium]WJW67510.1 cation-transporting P-type ATPase [Chloroflexota bacterium L227-S17]